MYWVTEVAIAVIACLDNNVMFAKWMSKESKIHAISLPQPVEAHIHLPYLKRKSKGPGKHCGWQEGMRDSWRLREFTGTQVCSLMMHSWGQKVWHLALKPGNFCALDETQ